jgi:hypothetical protein
VKRAYATTAHAVGGVARRVGVLGDEAPPTRHRVRHWLYSLDRVHDSLAIAQMDVPWWSYASIDAVQAWLDSRAAPVRVYEYGSGASTFWLARRAAEVHSVEHHREFGELMARELAGLDNVTLRLVEPTPSDHPEIGSAKEGYGGRDFSAYVRSIDRVSGDFDLVVVDGRAREACLDAALGRLAPGGLVVFDNSRRRRYRRAIASHRVVEERYLGLTPTLSYPDQTSLIRVP